ncbi:MAG TPA: rod shape-determining protein MreC [Thermoanaerobaculia bacterium]|nr:rod shape-determining protein MreC [Thermoanaerobaculia bacterium]
MDERRTGYLLLLVLVSQLVFVAVQGARGGGGPTYLERLGLRLVGPPARAVASAAHGVAAGRQQLRLQRGLLEENRRLREQVEALELRLLRLEDMAGEMHRLGSAVRYATPLLGQIRAVDVVYADYTSWLRTLLVYTGREPAAVNQPVLAPAGLVGRVVTVSGPYAKVQLITDRAASVGGMITRNRRQGVVRGSGQEGAALSLEYVPLSADVRLGDQVLTAGIDGVYPRGIPVGTVAAVDAGGGQMFHRIRLAPAVDLGSLDQVYLLEHAAVPQELLKPVPRSAR